MMEVRGISKKFNGVSALDDISFCCGSGRVLGIVGPNGSGKTTLLNVLGGDFLPDSGEILLQGKPIQGLSQVKRSRLLTARTYQQARLWPNHTVSEQVTLARTWGGGRAHGAPSTLDLLELVGLADQRHQLGGTLSFGQRRRLELARLLARPQADLYLLDEPSSGADVGLQVLFQDMISNLKKKGKVVFVVEHNLSFLAGVADELLLLVGGKVFAQGNPAELLRRPEVVRAYFGNQALS